MRTNPTQVQPELFVRRSSGLVREVSWKAAAAFNLFYASLPITFIFMALFGTAFYPGGNLLLATLIAFLISVPTALAYAMLNATLPRSGGDYVWISRAVHPAIGFSSSLSWTLWNVYFIGINGTLIGTYALAPMANVLTAYTGASFLGGIAEFVSSRGGILLTGSGLVLLSAAILAFSRGLRLFMRILQVLFIAWFFGTVVLPIIVLLTTTPSEFAPNFNQYVANLGGPAAAYQRLQDAAGFMPAPFSWWQTFLMITLPFFTSAFLVQSTYFGGEIKRPQKNAMLGIVVALFVACVSLLLLTIAAKKGIGDATLGSFASIDPADFAHGASPFTYTEIAGIASGSGIVAFLISLGMVAYFLMIVPTLMLILSRTVFAWAFDRLIPERLADVDPRRHSPTKAVALIAALGLLAFVVLTINPSWTALVGILGLTLTFVGVSVSAVLFPYRQERAFAASPFNRRVGGIPVMTILGVLGIIGMGIGIAAYLSDPGSGTSLSQNSGRVVFAVAVFVVGVPTFFIIRWVQRRARGVNIDLAYREVPPE